MIKVKIENGYYLFKLGDILKKKEISINKLMRDTNTDFKVLKRLISGELVRIDILVALLMILLNIIRRNNTIF